MDPDPITPQQTIGSLASITHFLWPFILLSLGVVLTPISPISWSYSTWLLFVIPLIITVFAPVRTFSGPLRFAYLEYASKIGSLAVSLLELVVVKFHSIPTLALSALFFLPVLPILLFVFFPALPVIWHFIAYHYRRRLDNVTTSASTITSSLDLAIAQARRADTLAHKYEKQALTFVSTTQRTASQTLALDANYFERSTAVQQARQSIRDEAERVRTLGNSLTDKMSYLEASIVEVESEAEEIRALLGQAVTTAVEGDVTQGETLTASAAESLKNVVANVQGLCSASEDVRQVWVELSVECWAIP